MPSSGQPSKYHPGAIFLSTHQNEAFILEELAPDTKARTGSLSIGTLRQGHDGVSNIEAVLVKINYHPACLRFLFHLGDGAKATWRKRGVVQSTNSMY